MMAPVVTEELTLKRNWQCFHTWCMQYWL